MQLKSLNKKFLCVLDGELKRNPKWNPATNPALSVLIILGHVFWELVIYLSFKTQPR